MEIRYARENDIEQLLNLEKEWLKEGISSNMQLSDKKDFDIAIKENRVLVANDNTNLIAYLLWRFYDDENCDLNALYTLPKFRSKKIAHKLMEKFLIQPKIQNCKSIYLNADSKEEDKLIKFYQRYGFNKIAITMKKNQ